MHSRRRVRTRHGRRWAPTRRLQPRCGSHTHHLHRGDARCTPPRLHPPAWARRRQIMPRPSKPHLLLEGSSFSLTRAHHHCRCATSATSLTAAVPHLHAGKRRKGFDSAEQSFLAAASTPAASSRPYCKRAAPLRAGHPSQLVFIHHPTTMLQLID